MSKNPQHQKRDLGGSPARKDSETTKQAQSGTEHTRRDEKIQNPRQTEQHKQGNQKQR